jgi:glycosyltransferase involved in cell wall biosynthesis
MRVLVVTNMYPSAERPGRGTFVRDQVEALRELPGIDVELFAFTPGGMRSYARAAATLARRRGRDGFDVVHAHYGLAGWSALGVRRARRVVTFHGTDLEHRVVGPLSRALAPFLDLPAAVSRTLAHRPRAGLPGAGRRRRVAVLPCGVDLDRFRPLDRAGARGQLGLDVHGRYLLFAADPARPEKRHDRALELAAASEAELLQLPAGAGADVPLYVNAATAVLVPSEREGFGLVTLEALACDVPVLATPVGVAPVALKGIEGTHCGSWDLDRWRDALAPHLDDPDPHVAGRARAALFERRRMAERVLRAYEELTGRPARRSSAFGPG